MCVYEAWLTFPGTLPFVDLLSLCLQTSQGHSFYGCSARDVRSHYNLHHNWSIPLLLLPSLISILWKEISHHSSLQLLRIYWIFLFYSLLWWGNFRKQHFLLLIYGTLFYFVQFHTYIQYILIILTPHDSFVPLLIPLNLFFPNVPILLLCLFFCPTEFNYGCLHMNGCGAI